MNAKKSVMVFSVVFAFVLSSCVSTRQASDVGIIEANTRANQRIEDAVGTLDAITRRSKERLDDVARRSGELEDGIGKLEFMFDAYAREVERLWDEIIACREKISKAEKGDFSWLSDTYFVNDRESVDNLFEN